MTNLQSSSSSSCFIKSLMYFLFVSAFYDCHCPSLPSFSRGVTHLTVVQANPVPPTMGEVQWNSNNEAVIVFCEGSGGRTYGYKLQTDTTQECNPAGVVVRMKPGQKYKMTLRNDASTVTNVHTHGLHISGDGDSDDPRRMVSPNNCLVYHWDISAEHMGGTFWMHAHVHGHTQAQVSGGAFSMLIVEEQIDPLKVINNYGPIHEPIKAWYKNELLLIASKVGNTLLGNGLSNYQMVMKSNEWYRLRIVAVDPAGKNNNLVFPTECNVHAAAHDGVWRFNVPKLTAATTYTLTAAGRIDVAIKCPWSADGKAVTFGRNNVATIVFNGEGDPSSANPFVIVDGQEEQWASYRPPYLQDLSNVANFETYGITMTAAQINGVSFDPDVPLGNWSYGKSQEWTISGSGAHPYHLHVYHMQAMPSCQNSIHDAGEYYDTISSTSGCKVRFTMIDYGGSVMMHCHVLAHEDNGSMTWANVVGGPTVPDSGDRYEQGCPGGEGSNPSPTPSPAPAPAPVTPSPSQGGTTVSPCANTGNSCINDSDCCSNSCSKGNPANRVCLLIV